jgi:hypothetical protein
MRCGAHCCVVVPLLHTLELIARGTATCLLDCLLCLLLYNNSVQSTVRTA